MGGYGQRYYSWAYPVLTVSPNRLVSLPGQRNCVVTRQLPWPRALPLPDATLIHLHLGVLQGVACSPGVFPFS